MNPPLGEIVATAPQPHRPRWWWLILGLPLLRWKRAMRVDPAPCVVLA